MQCVSEEGRYAEGSQSSPQFGVVQLVSVISGVAIGVNIGQTQTKVVAISKGEELAYTRIAFPTWSDGCERHFASLLNRTTEAINNLIETLDLRVPINAIGIAIGGIVRDGYLTTRSGVAAGMSESDFASLRNITALVQGRFGVTTLLCQDVVAKAHAIRLAHPRNALVLDIGTSTGGAFITADGTLPDYVNQVGRIAIDISDHAAPRDDGQGRGVLSKYLSYKGYQRLCLEYGLRDLAPEVVVQLADLGDQRATSLIEDFSKVLVDAVRTLNRYYNATVVVLTGGLVQTAFGARLLEHVSRPPAGGGSPLPSVVVSTNPLFEGAFGAARMAAARASTLEAIPGEVRRLLHKANTDSLPSVVASGTQKARRIRMDSVLGRNHYTNYNEQFIQRYIRHATRDQTFGEALFAKLAPEVSNLELVGTLTPQQVQTAAVSAIAHVTGRHDPFWAHKQLTNMAAAKMVRPLTLWMKANWQSPSRLDEHSISILKAFLTISALFNALDFFYPNTLSYSFQTSFEGRALSASEDPLFSWLQFDLEDLMKERPLSLIAHDDFEVFSELLFQNPGASILYFMDNAGEAVIDLLVAELMLGMGFSIVLVAGRDSFVDDITQIEVRELVNQSEPLLEFERVGQLQLASVGSDMTTWDDALLAQSRYAAGYVSKGMRKLGQLYYMDWRLAGLHVVLNKSDTVRRILRDDRGIVLGAEAHQKVVFLHSAQQEAAPTPTGRSCG